MVVSIVCSSRIHSGCHQYITRVKPTRMRRVAGPSAFFLRRCVHRRTPWDEKMLRAFSSAWFARFRADGAARLPPPSAAAAAGASGSGVVTTLGGEEALPPSSLAAIDSSGGGAAAASSSGWLSRLRQLYQQGTPAAAAGWQSSGSCSLAAGDVTETAADFHLKGLQVTDPDGFLEAVPESGLSALVAAGGFHLNGRSVRTRNEEAVKLCIWHYRRCDTFFSELVTLFWRLTKCLGTMYALGSCLRRVRV